MGSNQSSTSKIRRKKFQLLQDFSQLNVNVIDTLEQDDGTLVRSTLTTNTHGGANKLWRFDDLEGLCAAVSTGAVGYEKINPNVSLPIYKHYILTDEGFAWIKGVLLEHAEL